MSMIGDQERIGSQVLTSNHKWVALSDRILECRMLITPEDDGFVVTCLRLPGVVTQGDTIAESIDNMVDAFREAIRCYRDSEMAIPWQDVDIERPSGSVEKWILVNV